MKELQVYPNTGQTTWPLKIIIIRVSRYKVKYDSHEYNGFVYFEFILSLSLSHTRTHT